MVQKELPLDSEQIPKGKIPNILNYDSDENENLHKLRDVYPIDKSISNSEQTKSILFNQQITASITEDLMDKFYHETMTEMSIKDKNDGDSLPDFKVSVTNRNSGKKALEESNEDEITSKRLLLSLKKDLETEIQFSEHTLYDLNEQETILAMGNSRMTSEINHNKQLAEAENSALSDLLELSQIIEMEVEKKESSEQKKIITNLENSEDDTFTNSSIAYNILKLQYQIEEASRKLEDVNSIHNQHLMAKRRRLIEKHHLKEINQLKLKFEKKVSAETKRIEDKHNHDLQKLLEENRKVEEQEQLLESKFEFVVNEDGEQIMKTMERVMSMLKGREELPDGNYISVSRAIGYYSQLKDATGNGTFNVSLFKKFLREHKEFGFFVFDFEDFYSAAKVGGRNSSQSQEAPINGDESTTNQPRTILDPTENMYNNREEIPKFVEQELQPSQRPTLIRKKSIGNNSMNRTTNNSNNGNTNRFLNKSEGNTTAQDVLKRSMGVLSKINKIKNNK